MSSVRRLTHCYTLIKYNYHSLRSTVRAFVSLTSVCPSSTRSQAPLSMSQTRIVLSPDPEARRPSDNRARASTSYSI